MPRPAHAVPVPSPAPRRPREEKLPGPQDPELSCSRQCPHGEEHRQPKPAGRDPSCPSPAPRTPTAGVCPPGKAGSQAVGGSWPRQHAEARTAVLLHLQTGPEHSRAARGREGRPALARLALKDEDERSLSPPGEGPAGWWPLPAPKCSPGPSRADPGPDSSENCEESSTSGKSRRLWHATAAHVNKTGVFRGLAGPDRRPVKLTGLSRSPCSDPCPAGQASGARVPHGGGCRGPLTAPRAPGRRTPCMAVRPQPTGVRGHCRACGWGTLVSLSGTLATEPHIRGSEEN